MDYARHIEPVGAGLLAMNDNSVYRVNGSSA